MTDPRIEAALRAAWEYTYPAKEGCSLESYREHNPEVVENMVAAVIAALAAADAAAWRPIASAPEDATILTYYRDGRVMADTFPYRSMLEWQEQIDAPPIFWQPLPAPPANSAELGGVDG
ncbi:hypothetical protein [Acetobacter senegalensis]|uniref:hypothetical protein n=1 Tax=Acetobacter senegalensis TaxID=446692 RepID=UPI001EDC92B0|nr:hypothetical protein [Acetobacter senegalensis]MCG4256884.1 hypothetical protein [Acetobacter senegalensis]MCG4266978.1 hypothetical protein [Acetobacter senegalensis]